MTFFGAAFFWFRHLTSIPIGWFGLIEIRGGGKYEAKKSNASRFCGINAGTWLIFFLSLSLFPSFLSYIYIFFAVFTLWLHQFKGPRSIRNQFRLFIPCIFVFVWLIGALCWINAVDYAEFEYHRLTLSISCRHKRWRSSIGVISLRWSNIHLLSTPPPPPPLKIHQ